MNITKIISSLLISLSLLGALQVNAQVFKKTKCKNQETLCRKLSLESEGADVLILEKYLQEKGFFNTNELDTVYDNATKLGIEELQKSVDIRATGVLNSKTRKIINKEIQILSQNNAQEITTDSLETEIPQQTKTNTKSPVQKEKKIKLTTPKVDLPATETTTSTIQKETPLNTTQVTVDKQKSTEPIQIIDIKGNAITSNSITVTGANFGIGVKSTKIEYGTTELLGTVQMANITPETNGFFNATLENLTPATKYYYKVCSDNGKVSCSNVLNFTTKAFSDQPKFISKIDVSTEIKSTPSFAIAPKVAIDSKGNIYAVNRFSNEIKKYSSSGDFLLDFKQVKLENNEKENVRKLMGGIAIDENDSIYVSSQYQDETYNYSFPRVHKFDENGNIISSFISIEPTKNDDNPMQSHDSIKVKNGYVYISDNFKNALYKFAENGDFVSKLLVNQNTNKIKTTYIGAFTIDTDSNLYIINSSGIGPVVNKFDSNGNLVLSYGTYGSISGKFIEASDIALDNQNNVYIADRGNNRIQKFSPTGQYITEFGATGSTNEKLSKPTGLTIDLSGKIFVIGYNGDKIQVFQ